MGSNKVLCLFTDGEYQSGVWFIIDETILEEKVKAINSFASQYGKVTEDMLNRCLFSKHSSKRDRLYGYFVDDARPFLEIYREFTIQGNMAPVSVRLVKCNHK